MRTHFRPTIVAHVFVILLLFLPRQVAAAAAEPLNLVNMSVRVATAEPSTVGFVVSNASGGADNPSPIRLLIRAAGPSLRPFGVVAAEGVSLTINSTSTRILSRWSTDRSTIAAAAATVGAFSFTASVGDDAVIIEVPAGLLTVTVRATSTTSGETLIEAYKLPTPPPATPSAPTGLKATITALAILLDWNSNPEPNIRYYQIYRSTTNNPATAIGGGTSASPSFTAFAGLNRGIIYYFWVTAINTDSVESPKAGPVTGVIP